MEVSTLFDPVGFDAFLADYYEKKYLLIKRQDSGFYEQLFGLKDVDDVLFGVKNTAPDFRLVGSGEVKYPDMEVFCHKDTNVIDPRKYIGALKNGYTLAMAAMHDKHANMRKFCHDCESIFGHPFQSNFYLTPKNSKGFDPHYDTHDVIVLQLSGAKHWKIYSNNAVPLADKNLSFVKDGFDPGEVVAEIYLEQGDLLYIPRGLVHDAYTADEHSLHATIGVLGYTYANFLIENVLHAARKNPDFRRFLPLFTIDNPISVKHQENVDELLKCLKEELMSPQSLNRFIDQRHSSQKPISKGLLMATLGLDDVDDNTLFKFDASIHIRVDVTDEKIRLLVYDDVLEFPLYCQDDIERILQTKSWKPIAQHSSKLDDKGKLVLFKKLVSFGIVNIKNR